MPTVFDDGDAIGVLKTLATITAGASGDEYLSRLALHLYDRLGAVAVIVTEYTETETGPPKAKVSALAHATAFDQYLELALAGSAAGIALSDGKTLLKSTADLRQECPADQLLSIFECETYIVSPVFLSDGEPAGALTILLDCQTEACASIVSVAEIAAERIGAELQRVSYQRAASLSERRFRDFAETASDWFWEMDADLQFSYFSERFTEITGVSKNALLGKTRQETGIPNVDEGSWRDHLAALAAHQPFKNFVHPRTKQDGSTVWLSISGRPVFDHKGGFQGYRGIGQDICQIKEKEEALVDAIARAEQANRSKSEFLANMSHEIRTPMNGVMGMAELLGKTELNDKQQTFANIIVKSGSALLTIINDILDFSKIDAGQLVLDPQPFCLSEAIEDVAALISPVASEKGLELSVRVAPELPDNFVGDVGRLRQVVTNLVGNAVKFTEAGDVYIEVTPGDQTDVEASSRNLMFRVKDSGIGIPANRIAEIFDQFSQVDGSVTRKHGGTGLGLAISASLVELMGGKLEAESNLGEGSTFSFTVPLPVHDEAAKAVPVPRNLRGASVLVVDDNEINRSILLEQLRAWNFEAAACENALQAKAVLSAAVEKNIPIDLIILDYHMPEISGTELAFEIRRTAALSDVPMIMLTSVDQTVDTDLFAKLGIERHLTKPARSNLLLRTIVQALHGTRTHDASAVSDAPALAPEPEDTGAQDNEEATLDVLVADDNEVNRAVFTQILSNAGYTFKIASNGAEAVEYFQRCKPKLVCMDVSMPVLNGYEATEQIRLYEESTGTHIPIIGITAHAMAEDREKCKQSGMDDYLAKPVSPQMLIEMISSWFAKREQQTA